MAQAPSSRMRGSERLGERDGNGHQEEVRAARGICARLPDCGPGQWGGDGKEWGLLLPVPEDLLTCSPAPSCMPDGLGKGLGQLEGEPGPSYAATRGLKTRINVLFTEYWAAVGVWG